jgi:hypothetical protein
MNRWLRASATDDGENNNFLNVYAGRLWMSSGGSVLSGTPRVNNEVRGHAQIMSDKLTSVDLGTDWVPDEDATEWGFDYRGNDFGKSGTSQIPGFQLAASFRQPLTVYDGGSNPLIAEEPFTVYNSSTIDLTRAGADNAAIPVYSQSGGGTGWVLIEIEFDTPAPTEDGIYLAYAKSGGTLVSLVNLRGYAPTLTVSATGKARFYGGAFFGTHYGIYGGQFGWSKPSFRQRKGPVVFV